MVHLTSEIIFMKIEKNRRTFLKNFLLLGMIPFFSISNVFIKKLIHKKKFSKIWLLDINDY